jgi:hypothetical protein
MVTAHHLTVVVDFFGEDYIRLGRNEMKTLLSIAGVFLIVMGGIWFLQGIDILPGSFMTGRIEWAVYGGIAAVAGIVVVILANRRKGPPRPKTIV